jgi:predicted RNase H-like HicB family nuclease
LDRRFALLGAAAEAGVIWILTAPSEQCRRRILVARTPRILITFKIETEREHDGRWLAEVVELRGVLAYGDTQQAALSRVQALALRVGAERLEHGETGRELLSISFNAG